MAQCSGCSIEFPLLSSSVMCSRCEKKGLCDRDKWSEIDNEPQCQGCGVVYRFLTEKYCGACKKTLIINPPVVDGNSALGTTSARPVSSASVNLAASIGQSAGVKEKNASVSRLFQKKSVIPKDRLDTLRKVNNNDNFIRLEMSLWYWPLKRNKTSYTGISRKVAVNAISESFPLKKNTSEAIDSMLERLQINFLTKIPDLNMRPDLSFSRDSINISLQASSGSSIDLDPSFLCSTIETFLEKLKAGKYLSERKIKEGKIPLRVVVFEKCPELEDMDNDSDGDDDNSDGDEEIIGGKKRSKSAPVSSPSSVKRTRYIGPPREAFKSAFRSLVLPSVPEMPLEFESIKFQRIEYHISETGLATMEQSVAVETIEIVKGWKKHANVSAPKGGFISSGFSKYAFKGKMGNDKFAIFQCKPMMSSNSINASDLLEELKLLNLGQYFINIFYDRAREYDCDYMIPSQICWNVGNTFVGRVIDPLKKYGLEAFEDNDTSLLYTHFLAAPFLPVNNKLNKEIKFSGNTDIGNHSNGTGAVLDAFAHSTLVDSNGEIVFVDIQGLIWPGSFPHQRVVLFDPQAHTRDQLSEAVWDKGREGIKTFIEKHVCNFYCEALHLEPLRNFNISRATDDTLEL